MKDIKEIKEGQKSITKQISEIQNAIEEMRKELSRGILFIKKG